MFIFRNPFRLRIWIAIGVVLLFSSSLYLSSLVSNHQDTTQQILYENSKQNFDSNKMEGVKEIKNDYSDENYLDQQDPTPKIPSSTKLDDSTPKIDSSIKVDEMVDQEKNFVDLHPSMKAVTFYYPWYGNIEHNGQWMHWNHQVLVDKGSFYEPPDDIGANFYPLLGPYSSIDPQVVEAHMKWMSEARIGVVCTSWWGRSSADSQLVGQREGYTDSLVKMLLDMAQKYKLQVAIHLEPYKGRGATSVRKDLEYVNKVYGSHPALYRDKNNGNRPIYFLYDSYLTSANEWATILSPNGAQTIRGTESDAILISLYVDSKDRDLILKGNFDGFYTYFATDGFTHGSTTRNWMQLSQWATEHHKFFIPCVGPGYDDTRIRPWNPSNRRDREGGRYYDKMWENIRKITNWYMVGITSFNEWHEGTQIEPSIPKEIVTKGGHSYKYSDFTPNDSFYYLTKTKQWIDEIDPI